MYRARTHYTILDDLPTFGRAHHLPTFRVMIDSALTALGCLLCALAAVLDSIARRLDRAGIVLLGECPTDVHTPLIQWEGATYSDHDTEVSLHLDPMADTEVSPALEERPVLIASELVTATPLDQKHMVHDVWPIWTTAQDRYNPPASRTPVETAVVMPSAAQVTTDLSPRVIVGPGAKFRFSPEYLEKMGGPIVAVEPAAVPTRKPSGKRCELCGQVKPRREFPTVRTEDGKHTRWCASCIDAPPPESTPAEVPAAQITTGWQCGNDSPSWIEPRQTMWFIFRNGPDGTEYLTGKDGRLRTWKTHKAAEKALAKM